MGRQFWQKSNVIERRQCFFSLTTQALLVPVERSVGCWCGKLTLSQVLWGCWKTTIRKQLLLCKNIVTHFVDPTVCYSHGSGLAENGSYVSEIGYFVCPYDYDDALTDTYCCGPRDRETCCGFWDEWVFCYPFFPFKLFSLVHWWGTGSSTCIHVSQ